MFLACCFLLNYFLSSVRHNIEIAGEAGGLLYTPPRLLKPEVPRENIDACVEACREFRLA